MGNRTKNIKKEIKELLLDIVKKFKFNNLKEFAEKTNTKHNYIYRAYSENKKEMLSYSNLEKLYYILIEIIQDDYAFSNYGKIKYDLSYLLGSLKENYKNEKIKNELSIYSNNADIKKKCSECGKMYSVEAKVYDKYYCSEYCHRLAIDYIYQINKKIKKEMAKDAKK